MTFCHFDIRKYLRIEINSSLNMVKQIKTMSVTERNTHSLYTLDFWTLFYFFFNVFQ